MRKNPTYVLWLFMLILLTGCVSDHQFSEENQELTKKYRTLYMQGSPEWEDAKKEWLNLGEVESRCLVNFLIIDIKKGAIKFRKDDSGKVEPGWCRPVRELLSLGDLAIEPLLKTLKESRDEIVIDPCVEALANIVYFEDVKTAFFSNSAMENQPYQCRLVKLLFKLEESEALSLILDILNGDYNWQVKATAASILKNYEGVRVEEVIAALNNAMNANDDFIVTKAKKSLLVLKKKQADNKNRN